MQTKLLLIISILSLGGCALWHSPEHPPTPIDAGQTVAWVDHLRELTLLRDWQIKGKIGVRTAEDGGSAYLDWSQSMDSFYILLSGPLGQGSTVIDGNPYGARLQNSEGTFLSESPEELVLTHTGWNIPIQNLLYWVKGIPAPYGKPEIKLNALGTIEEMVQDGWHLTYSRYGNAMGNILPQRIIIDKDELKVTFIIKEWLPLTPVTDT